MNKKHDREQVLTTGLDLFWSNGYSNLGMNEICKTTGMTKGAFYNAYESKEKFFLESIELYGDMMEQSLQGLINEKGEKTSALQRLRGMYDALIGSQSDQKFRGCLVHNSMSESSAQSAHIRDITTKQFERALLVIEPLVKQAQNDGDLLKDISSQEITELLHTTLIGIATRIKGLQNVGQGKKTMTLLINSLRA